MCLRFAALPGTLLVFSLACSGGDGKADAGTDADADTDADSDSDTDTGTDECANVVCDQECVRFADVEAGAGGDGLSWDTAFQKVQSAIDSAAVWAACCGTPGQVWIARGRYFVYESGVHDTIDLADRLQIFGSFSKEEGDPDERDIEANPTILDGRAGADSEDRVYHVVSAIPSHEDEVFLDVILDGLTITHGAAMGDIVSTDASGGGLIWLMAGNPIVRNCTFSDNRAVSGVAGAQFGWWSEGVSLSMENTLFIGNESPEGYGGALVLAAPGETVISRCRFIENASHSNSALWTISGHATSMDILVENSVFWSNKNIPGHNAVSVISGVSDPSAMVRIYNSIFIDNYQSVFSSEQVEWFRGEVSWDVRNSIDINSAIIHPISYAEYNLIDVDPLFVDPENGDFRLQPGSPCIDAADGTVAPEFDFAGNPRVDDPASPDTGVGPPWADIGAFEYQPE